VRDETPEAGFGSSPCLAGGGFEDAAVFAGEVGFRC
jgi:hypothetical protein